MKPPEDDRLYIFQIIYCVSNFLLYLHEYFYNKLLVMTVRSSLLFAIQLIYNVSMSRKRLRRFLDPKYKCYLYKVFKILMFQTCLI